MNVEYTVIEAAQNSIIIAETKTGLVYVGLDGNLAGLTEFVRRWFSDVQIVPSVVDAAFQIEEFMAGDRSGFDVSLDLQGTDFQREVWAALCEIPFGQTRTYGRIAESVGKPGGAQAVGQACGANPIPIVVPCHRVLAANNDIGGYTGGLDWKRKLLALEGIEM